MSKKKIGGLGRGLGALIPGMEKPVKATAKEKKAEPEKTREVIKEVIVKESDGKPIEIAIDAIKINPNQPRTEFDQNSLQDLCSSVKEYGVLQPILVRKTVKGYELIAGERRYRAATMAGLKKVPAYIKEFNDIQMTEVALIENLQRENLSPIEEAKAYDHLLANYGLTQEMLSNKIGRSRSHIANFLRLLKLTETVQKYLAANTISMGQAKPLLALDDKKLQEKAAEFIIENDLPARKVESLVKQLQKNPGLFDEAKDESPAESHDITPNEVFILDAEDKLKMVLGTGVRIKTSGRKRIEIDFASMEELDRVIELLTGIQKNIGTDDKQSKIEALRKFSTSGSFSV